MEGEENNGERGGKGWRRKGGRRLCPLLQEFHGRHKSGYSYSHSSSERSERFVRFEPNVRSERVRYFSERETNDVQALKRLLNLIAVK